MSPDRAASAADWTQAVALYHQGDWSLAALQEYSQQARLPEAASRTVRIAIETGLALGRRRNLETLNKLIKRKNARPAKLVYPVELKSQARYDLLCDSPTLGATTKTPSHNLKEACELRCTIRYAPPEREARSLELVRYLNDEWKLIVTVSRDAGVIRVACGDKAMSSEHGIHILSLGQTSSDGSFDHWSVQNVAELACREVVLTFGDGPPLTVVFA